MSASSGRARHLNTPPQAQRQLDESKHSAKTTELLSSQGLGKNICYLLLCTDINQVDVSRQDLLSNKMVMNLNVLGPSMKNWVLG